MNRRTTVILISLLVLLLSYMGCMRLRSCEFHPIGFSIDTEKMHYSGGLINGADFMEIEIDSMGPENCPAKYHVKQCFGIAYTQLEGVRQNWPNTLYFNKENEGFTWDIDSVDSAVTGILNGKVNSWIKIDKPTGDTLDFTIPCLITKHSSSLTCPVKFKPDTWYYATIYDAGVNCIFFYVDDKMQFNVKLIPSGVSPI